VPTNPKVHHYVSQWHLKRFAADPKRPRLACYSKSEDRFFVATIKNLAAIGHYHTWRHDGINDPLLEKASTMIETRASEVLPKLERGHKLTGTEPNVVAGYVAFQQGRVPAARDVFQELIEHIGQRGTEAELSKPLTPKQIEQNMRHGLGSTPEEVEELRQQSLEAVRTGGVKITMDHIVTASIGAIHAEQAIPILEAMSWLVVEPAPGEEFVISDNPVVLFSDETPSGVPVNLLTLDVEVSMPLSRRGMLIMSHIPTVGGHACATAEAVLHLNRRRWLTAKEYVFGSSEEVLRRVCEGMPLDIRSRQLGGLRLQSIDDINDAIERSLHS
jgi:hypothetical protein